MPTSQPHETPRPTKVEKAGRWRLPQHLAQAVNADVVQGRRERIREITMSPERRDQRRRYIETIVDHHVRTTLSNE